MRIHRRCTVFGSRMLFFALAPWLIVCLPLFPYMALNFGHDLKTTLLAVAASLLCLLGLLVTIDSWRFLRLTIGFLWLVPVAYVAYFGYTWLIDGMALKPSHRFSQVSPFNALAGLLVWGVPAILGAQSLRKKERRIRAVEARRRTRRSIAG